MDKRIKEIEQMPYTISFVIRKRQQIDSFNELPEEKRPPEKLIWEGSAEDIDKWLAKVLDRKETQQGIMYFDEDEIER